MRREASNDADGIIQALKVLQAMEDRGMLDILLALLQRGEGVLAHVVDVLAKPEVTSSLETLIKSVQALGKLNSVGLLKTLDGVTAGLDRVAEAAPPEQHLGVYDVLRRLKDPDVNAGLAFALDFLQGMGRAVRTSGTEADAVGP